MKHVETIRADQWHSDFQREVDAGHCIVYQESITEVHKAEDQEYDHYYYESDVSSGEIWVNHQEPFNVYWREQIPSDKDDEIKELKARIEQLESIVESVSNLTQGIVY